MANVTAADVKKLRQATNCGMLDCKNALIEADGNFDEAVTILRKKAGIKAGKKADRETKEGLTTTIVEGNVGVIVQVSCETDFVAKNERFVTFVNDLAKEVFERNDEGDLTEALSEEKKDLLTEFIGSIGENMRIVKAVRWVSAGKVGAYIHGGGRIGVLVDVEGDADEALVKDLGMHIAAMNPSYVSADEIPAEDIAKEKDIAAEKAKGKPENIAEKIVNGAIAKWQTEVCLVQQAWFKDDKTNFTKLAPNANIKQFVRLEIGA